MSQLFYRNGILFNYQEFLQHYQIPITPKQFSIVLDAIPSGALMLFRGYISTSVLDGPSVDVTESTIGKVCFDPSGHKNNRGVRALFQHDIVSSAPAISFWNSRIKNLS